MTNYKKQFKKISFHFNDFCKELRANVEAKYNIETSMKGCSVGFIAWISNKKRTKGKITFSISSVPRFENVYCQFLFKDTNFSCTNKVYMKFMDIGKVNTCLFPLTPNKQEKFMIEDINEMITNYKDIIERKTGFVFKNEIETDEHYLFFYSKDNEELVCFKNEQKKLVYIILRDGKPYKICEDIEDGEKDIKKVSRYNKEIVNNILSSINQITIEDDIIAEKEETSLPEDNLLIESALSKDSAKINKLIKKLNTTNRKAIKTYYIDDLNRLILNYNKLDKDTKDIVKENIKLLKEKIDKTLEEQEQENTSLLKVDAVALNKLLKI